MSAESFSLQRRLHLDRLGRLARLARQVRRIGAVGAVGLAGLAIAGSHGQEPPPAGRSGYGFMGPALQAMQRDDSLNPAMLWVQEGRTVWRAPAPGGACADCHGPEPGSRLAGVAARYPAWDAASGRALNLGQRVDACRVRHQRAPAFGAESPVRLALEAALGHASRGTPVAPPVDARLAQLRTLGAQLWQTRLGQLDLSCAQCHDAHVGARLGGSPIPPGNGLGYPTYRLQWETLGSLQRRLRNCLTGVRAEPFATDAQEWIALELHLALRDRGLPIESPAVRP
jgi:sulfur-oxidizing protein SoxA